MKTQHKMFIDDMSSLCGVPGRTEMRKHLVLGTAEHQNIAFSLRYMTKLHLSPNIVLMSLWKHGFCTKITIEPFSVNFSVRLFGTLENTLYDSLKSWSEHSTWGLYPHLMFPIKPEGERRKRGEGEESEFCSTIYYLDSLKLKKKPQNIWETWI